MLDIKLLRQDLSKVADLLSVRGFKLDVEAFTAIETSRASLQADTQELQSRKNKLAKELGMAKARDLDSTALMQEASEVSAKLKQIEKELEIVLAKQSDFVAHIPNILDESVPSGVSEEDNVEIKSWGQAKEFNFTVKDHVELGVLHQGLSLSKGAKLSGSRFVVLEGNIARLHRALCQFMLDLHVNEHGYTESYVPYIVNADCLYGTGQLPKFAEDVFKFDEEQDKYLIPTAEVPLTNLVRDSILDEEQLPLKYVAHTPCFRREAGSYGKDLHGIFRLHQFDKVELVQITKPEQSSNALENILSNAEKVLQQLELPYRVMLLCSGDTGFSANKTYDIEVWLPAQQQYREISSCSNTDSFQARRMQIRSKNKAMKKPSLVHTLNGSGVAVGRALIALLENHQLEDGSIYIPKALQPYLNGAKTIHV